MPDSFNPRTKIAIKKTYPTSPEKYYIHQDDRMDNWIGHSKLKHYITIFLNEK